jgi:hypothetical protein
MAKPTEAGPTLQEVEEMERQVAAFRQRQAEEEQQARREAAAPLLDLVASDGFKAVRDAIPALEALALQERAQFPALRPHVMAIETGLDGLAGMAANMGYVAPAADAEAAA